jgi:hypothetical protein
VTAGFDSDPHPGQPKILFVGFGDSSHTHAWIDLLAGGRLNIRLFALPTLTPPPADWPIPTYLSGVQNRRHDPASRKTLYPRGRLGWLLRRLRGRTAGDPERVVEAWLAAVIRRWRPQLVHTLGLVPAGLLYHRSRQRFAGAADGRWLLQLRGGSDLHFNRLDPELAPAIRAALCSCDQLISDNLVNLEWAVEMGMPEERFADIAPIPGTGGVDVDGLAATAVQPPSARRTILWPKAYESPWSKALPVLEALRSCWERLQPCRVEMLHVGPEVEAWCRSLPDSIRNSCSLSARLPRPELLERLARSRVLLAPSLVDGTPNVMFEAMASGALPLLSPLDTIRPIVRDGEHVLFARNLHPEEIAAALVRAMTDDELVDRAAARNLEQLRLLADRRSLAPRVIEYYRQQAAASGSRPELHG